MKNPSLFLMNCFGHLDKAGINSESTEFINLVGTRKINEKVVHSKRLCAQVLSVVNFQEKILDRTISIRANV